MPNATKPITLGSGRLYIKAYNAGDTISLKDICVEDNRLGHIQGGATLEYKPTTYEVKDDMNEVYRRFITAEEAKLKSGVLTWDVEALNKIVSNGRYTSTETMRMLKLGGLGARQMDMYVVVFEHVGTGDRAGKNLRVGLVGTNDSGLTMAFATDKETVVDAEFHAIGHDDAGTLVIIEEDIPAA